MGASPMNTILEIVLLVFKMIGFFIYHIFRLIFNILGRVLVIILVIIVILIILWAVVPLILHKYNII